MRLMHVGVASNDTSAPMDTKPTSPVRAEPHVTPLIERVDAVLVLLIILLVAMPMLVRGFNAEPRAAVTVEPRPEF